MFAIFKWGDIKRAEVKFCFVMRGTGTFALIERRAAKPLHAWTRRTFYSGYDIEVGNLVVYYRPTLVPDFF